MGGVLVNKSKGLNTENDTFSSLISGYGLSRQRSTLDYFYRSSWECKKVVDYYPDRMVKGWGELGLADQNNIELIDKTKPHFDGLKTNYNIGQKVAYLYGDAFFVRYVDDGRDLDEPINWDDVRSIEYSRVFDPTEIKPHPYTNGGYIDGYDYYNPEYYETYITHSQGTELQQYIHSDRILRFSGDFLPPHEFELNHYLHASILEIFIEPYAMHHQALRHVGEALASFEFVNFQIEDWFDTIAHGSDEQIAKIKKRLVEAHRQLSSKKGVTTDKDSEAVQIVQRRFNNISELLNDVFKKEKVAASRMDLTSLYGEHPNGMQSTGESQLRTDAEKILELQELKWRSNINFDTRLKMAELGVKDGYYWTWKSTYQPTKAEELANRLAIAQRDKLYVEMGSMNGDEPRQRFTGNEYKEELALTEKKKEIEDKSIEPQDNNQSQNDRNDVVDKFTTEGSLVFDSDFASTQLEDLEAIEDD